MKQILSRSIRLNLNKQRSSGFSLIELMIVILILGIIASLGLPRLSSVSMTPLETFIVRLNALVQAGAQAALEKNSIQKILFLFPAHKVELQDTSSQEVESSMEIPESLEFGDVIINGKSQFSASGGEKHSAYFLINPDGVSQEVTITVSDKNRERAGQTSIELNPFTAQFQVP